ncbi:1523_t:CDS:2 [Dentiscutata erythropus]|uniref:1523_t:CDS:1 n=1 Tax=Dentiscutata erythropus TaxID=1348616 RepID=A0A9N9EV96_9GLOM|nr:1523_t:CDS:2 [Dentiscutata erythropus]
MTSVASRNLFDLLVDNEDVDPIVQEKESSKKESTTTVVVQKKVDRSRATPKEARIRHEYPQRGGFKAAPTNNRNEDTRSGAAPRDRNVGPRLSGRRGEEGDYPNRTGRGARSSERGRGGGRGGGNRRGREFDRHSGTGKYDSEKKENQAWGNPAVWDNNEPTWSGETKENDAPATSSWNEDEKQNDNWGGANGHESNANAKGETPVGESGANENENPTTGWDDNKAESKEWEMLKEETTTAGGETTAPVAEQEVVKTYDEFLAEKAQKALDLSLPEARKPNEGVDDSQWKDAVPLEKDDEDVLFAGKEQAYRLKSKKSKAKNYLEIETTFDRPGANFPRGRGRGRGGGSRGGRGERRDNRDGRERDRRDNYRERENYDNENRDNRRRGGRGEVILVQYHVVSKHWNRAARTDEIAKKIEEFFAPKNFFNKFTTLDFFLGTSNEDERRYLLLSEDSVKTIRLGLETFTSASFSSMPSSHYTYSDVVRVSVNAPSMFNKVTKDIQKYNKGVRTALKLRGMKNMWEKARNMIQEKKNLFMAVDVESYERDHSCILEVGWSMYDSKNDLIMDRHFCVTDYRHLRNGQFVPDMKDRFTFGTSVWANQKTIKDEFTKDLESQLGSVVLVGHDIKTDVKYLESMGIDVSSVIERFDTADMNAARVGKPNERINLGRLLDELDIENYSLHNAGNDAHYTLRLFLELCKLPLAPPEEPNASQPISDDDWI